MYKHKGNKESLYGKNHMAYPLLALIALLFAAYKTHYVSKAAPGNARMQEIASAIAEGANAFLMGITI